MISEGHNKHIAIQRIPYGNFGRNEWAILGTTCSAVTSLTQQVFSALGTTYKCAYVDSIHKEQTGNESLSENTYMELAELPNSIQLRCKLPFTPFQSRNWLNEADLVIVNGNHHQAYRQILVLDENKKTSLYKRKDQLTNVELILLMPGVLEVFDFVSEILPHAPRIPVYSISETSKIISFFNKALAASEAKVNGLILAGGYSKRMGRDKSLMTWHHKEQRYFMADLLSEFCAQTFISCRSDQKQTVIPQYNVIEDSFTGLGPYGGILSAFREQPDSAWLVVACDLPLLNKNTISHLLANRNPSSMATAFMQPDTGLPEPLIAIWEPKSYPALLNFLAQGVTCPRKFLIHTNCTLLDAPDASELANVNTPEDAKSIEGKLSLKNQF